MLPRYHILLGLIFSIFVFIMFPQIGFGILIILFASIFIDFDHYLFSVIKTKKIQLHESFKYHRETRALIQAELRRGIKRKGDFHIFHTIEFHLLILILGLFFHFFMLLFIGMLFHSITDVIDLSIRKEFHKREYFLVFWIIRKFKKKGNQKAPWSAHF